MRTPNTQCFLCQKPLYRRPSDMAKARYAACMTCRSEAQKVAGITERQQSGLSLGREKGTNHRTGYSHKEESKTKIGESNRKFWVDNPEKAVRRGEKTRGELHYKWKGGATKINRSIRLMTENRKWMGSVKLRDGRCVRCGSADNLESHHVVSFSDLVEKHDIRSRDDAREHASILWDIDNGITLCQTCHFAEHGRTGAQIHGRHNIVLLNCAKCGKVFACRPSLAEKRKYCSKTCQTAARKGSYKSVENPNYKGGLRKMSCVHCGNEFGVKAAILKRGGGKFCSRACTNANRRKSV